MERMDRDEMRVGAKIMICDRKTIAGREYLAYEPAVIERDYRGDPDFNGSFLVRLEHNNKSYGVHSTNIFKRTTNDSILKRV